ncbi:MAG TPA: hypothetical protein PLB96_08875 [Syntrophales bacterium]|nr:hypothetical protein [Syntrophales bacterium]
MSRGVLRVSALSGCLIALALLLSLFAACSYREGASVMLHHDGETALRKIAVLPFQSLASESGAPANITCPICGNAFHTEPVSGDLHPERIVEKIFLKKLELKTKIDLLAGEKVAGIYQRVHMDAAKKAPLSVIKEIGDALGADGVIAGYVFRFRERKGFAYSVERPASVAFEIHLIRSSDAVIIWKGSYDRTQSSLLENLLQIVSFYRQRGQWVTAEELTEEGIEEIVKSFPTPQ